MFISRLIGCQCHVTWRLLDAVELSFWTFKIKD